MIIINHIRNLLLNTDGYGYIAGDGEEFIPKTYLAVVVPDYIQKLRVALFGTSPDRATLLCRTRQYLAILHASELAEFVIVLDSRLTYLPLDETDIVLRSGTSVLAIGHNFSLYMSGDSPTADNGVAFYSWRIVVT